MVLEITVFLSFTSIVHWNNIVSYLCHRTWLEKLFEKKGQKPPAQIQGIQVFHLSGVQSNATFIWRTGLSVLLSKSLFYLLVKLTAAFLFSFFLLKMCNCFLDCWITYATIVNDDNGGEWDALIFSRKHLYKQILHLTWFPIAFKGGVCQRALLKVDKALKMIKLFGKYLTGCLWSGKWLKKKQ